MAEIPAALPELEKGTAGEVPGREVKERPPLPGAIPSRHHRLVAVTFALATAGLGLLGLVGYISPLTFLRNLHPNSIDMVWPTMVFFMMLGLALMVHLYRVPFFLRRWLVPGVCSVVFLWCALELVELGLRQLGYEKGLISNQGWAMILAIFQDSGMSPGSAGSFLLISMALMALWLRPGRGKRKLVITCAAVTGALNFMLLFGYLLGRNPFKQFLEIEVAFPAALSMVLLSWAMINAAGCRNFLLYRFYSRDATGLLLRAFLPTVLGLIVLGELARHHFFQSMSNLVEEKINWGQMRSLKTFLHKDFDWQAGEEELRKLEKAEASRIQERKDKKNDLNEPWGSLLLVKETDRDLWLAFQALWIYLIAVALGYMVYRVAGKVGGSLEKARAELKHTMEELQVARERAESATVARDFFLAQVSHELRTPLNHVLGFCQLLEFTPLEDSQQQDLKKIRRAGNHLQALIDDILDYQRIIMGKIPLEWEDFEIGPWITEVAESMGPKVAEKANRLVIQCPAGLGRIHSDRKRFRQVLSNLLSNAAKFTTDGQVTVSARVEAEGGRDWLVVSVTDTGKGISAENQQKLFLPFGQLSDRRDNPEGIGLGLAICKTLCHKLGGDIEVASVPGQGSTFTFRLPVSPAGGRAASAGPAAAEKPSVSLPSSPLPASVQAGNQTAVPDTPCTVLVIDDDVQVGELMKRYLEKQGFTIQVASSGVQALDMVKRLRPDVITLDVLMPGGIDGWAVLAALKNDAEIADIPVVIVSIVDDRSRGYLLGANEYMVKPIDWERLAALMRKYHTPPGGVLVVDDDAHWRELCRRTLEPGGWKVMEAADGASALRQLAGHRPSLILLDLMMPVMDGFELLEQVRLRPEWEGIPIVVITAKELTDEDRWRLNGRVQDILEKGRRGLNEVLADMARDVKRLVPARPAQDKELLHV